MKRSTTSLLVGAFLFLGAVATVRGQTYQGGIRGTVKEGTNVAPGVSVQLINEATNLSRSTVTNSVGEYDFSSVAPGTYTLKATLQGFKPVTSKGIRIGTQQFITLDLALEIGNLAEAVEVVGQSPLLETSNASVGETLDKRQLETLPTAGRNPFFLAITTPNVVPTGDPQFVRQQDQTNSSLLTLAGGPTRANNYTLDGVSITDIRNRATIIPTIEATEEVKVQVSTYDAQMGRTGGGVFNTTGKSGSNTWHGSALGQNRPKWGRSNDFFSRDQPKPDTYFYLYGGSVGGPIVKDKTFFWAAAEGYKTKTAGSKDLYLPTAAERNGDFSQSGFTVYDPLTTRPNPSGSGFIRDPFPGNVIPANRINPVSKAMAAFLPLPTSGHSRPSTAELIDRAIQATFKLDHKFSEKDQASAMYLYYNSTEPEARFFSKNLGDNPADPGEGALYRTVHVVAVNNTYQASPDTVVTLRYGYTSFLDNCVPNKFDPGTLGFSQAFLNQITSPKFPYVVVPGYDTSTCCDAMVGDRSRQDTTYYSHNANIGATRLFGRHSVKGGLDYRKIGLKNTSFGDHSGAFNYDSGFTQGPNPLVGGQGDPFASFLLGFPASGDFTVGTPNNFYINYYAGYLHDDFHASSKLTVNYGLRYEFEQGLQETQNHFTVGFSRDAPFPVQVPGLNLKGGLMYAGVNGNPTHQGDPSHAKFGPRVGFAWSPETRTVVRAGYGLFWSPNQYAFPNENRYGARGYTAVTDMVTSIDGLTPCSVLPASRGCPTFSMTNPFPSGVEQPVGNSLGLLTGAGGTVNFVDQFRKSARVHQYSVEIQRELGADMMASISYVGARSEHLSLGGVNSNTVNINQLDPKFLSLGSALQDQVPNPFFGNPAFGAFADQQTIARGQLLRPYPQFGNVLGHQVSDGKARYNAFVAKLEKRFSHGWSARINYTYSSNKDNLTGATNFFSDNNRPRALDVYNFNAEYGPSILETPHRLNITGTVELPFGEGKRWANSSGPARTLLGGWSVTVFGAYQSGFPVVIIQSNANTGLFNNGQQRPNQVSGVDPGTSGSTEDRLNNWFNPAAWTQAAPFTLGNQPRTDSRVRTPFKKNTDVSFLKNTRIGGSRVLQLRLELINAFNNPNFLGPNVIFGSSNFGRITAVRGFPRMVQLMARFAF